MTRELWDKVEITDTDGDTVTISAHGFSSSGDQLVQLMMEGPNKLATRIVVHAKQLKDALYLVLP